MLKVIGGLVVALAVTWMALLVALILVRPKGQLLREAMRLLPDLLRLLPRLARDRSLPGSLRFRLWLLLGYLAVPIDLIPDFIPVVGYADDAIIVAWVLRSVLDQCTECRGIFLDRGELERLIEAEGAFSTGAPARPEATTKITSTTTSGSETANMAGNGAEKAGSSAICSADPLDRPRPSPCCATASGRPSPIPPRAVVAGNIPLRPAEQVAGRSACRTASATGPR